MRTRLWCVHTNLTGAFKRSVRLGSHDPARKQTNDVIVYNYSGWRRFLYHSGHVKLNWQCCRRFDAVSARFFETTTIFWTNMIRHTDSRAMTNPEKSCIFSFKYMKIYIFFITRSINFWRIKIDRRKINLQSD